MRNKKYIIFRIHLQDAIGRQPVTPKPTQPQQLADAQVSYRIRQCRCVGCALSNNRATGVITRGALCTPIAATAILRARRETKRALSIAGIVANVSSLAPDLEEILERLPAIPQEISHFQ